MVARPDEAGAVPPLGPAGRLARFFVDSKVTPLLVIAALAMGLLAVTLTPREEEPQIVVPMVDLFVGLPGASPQEVETRATVPLEKRMWEIPGVEYVYSVSMPGLSMVTVRFLVGEDEEASLVKVYEKLVSGLDRLEEGFTLPLARLRSIDDVPVLALTLWSRDLDHFSLRRLAAELEREIARVDDVSESRLIGGRRRQVRILLSPARLAARGLDPLAVARALAAQNTEVPAGSFEALGRQVQVQTGAFLRDAGDVADLVVDVHAGRAVRLRDVAQVEDGPEEIRDYVLFAPGPAFGAALAPGTDVISPAVTLAVAKRKGADASRVVEAVLERLEELRGRLLPPQVNVTVTRDYGATATEKAGELLTHLVAAIVSVTVVVGLFLGWRGGLVVFVSVPVTFALTLFVYYVFDYTLNRVTLFALIFVTGIVVDDSIIVVENVVRHFSMRRRATPLQDAITAVDEVGNPTILATLTVIAAVLPMAFVRGLMGPYMRPMPVGASLAMTFSLFIALMAAPWFSVRLLRGGGHGRSEEDDIQSTRTYRVYRAVVAPLLARRRNRWVFLAAVTLLLLASLALVPLKLVTVKMLPFDNKSEMQVVIDMPEGTTLEETASVAREMAAWLRTVAEVTDLQIYAGTAAPVNFNGLVRHYDLRDAPHQADIQVNLVHKNERHHQSHDLARRIRGPLQKIAGRRGAALKVVEIPPGPPVLATLVAEVYGPTPEARLELARRVKDVFREAAGVVDVDWMVEDPQPKQLFRVDKEKAALHGVAAAEVARVLRLALDGEDAGLLHDRREAEAVFLRLQLPREERSSVADLGRIRLASRLGALVPLSELVSVEETTVDQSRHRKNLRPVVYVTGDVSGSEESPVYAILDMASRIAVLQHYRAEPVSLEQAAVKWDGEWQITYEVFRDLGIAFGLVLVLIYFLIIGWFRSFTVPVVMMIAIPLALVGVLPGHWLFGAFFTATSMIGFIALAGIMVRNSVLLIDFVDLARRQGRDLAAAVLEAGAVRFRPILLTAGTVVVGAVVILFDPIFQGLAISLMAGAFASTVLTLVVVPLVHFMVESRKERT